MCFGSWKFVIPNLNSESCIDLHLPKHFWTNSNAQQTMIFKNARFHELLYTVSKDYFFFILFSLTKPTILPLQQERSLIILKAFGYKKVTRQNIFQFQSYIVQYQYKFFQVSKLFIDEGEKCGKKGENDLDEGEKCGKKGEINSGRTQS